MVNSNSLSIHEEKNYMHEFKGNRISNTILLANGLNLFLTVLIIGYSLVSGHLNHDHVLRAGVFKRIYLALAACYLWWEWRGLLNACARSEHKEWQLKACFICFWTMSLLIIEIVLFHLIGSLEADFLDLIFNYVAYGLVMLNGLVMVNKLVDYTSDPVLLEQYQHQEEEKMMQTKIQSDSIFKPKKRKKVMQDNYNPAFPSLHVGIELSAYDPLD